MSSPALGPCICNHLLSIKTLHPKKAHAARSLSDAISSPFFFPCFFFQISSIWGENCIGTDKQPFWVLPNYEQKKRTSSWISARAVVSSGWYIIQQDTEGSKDTWGHRFMSLLSSVQRRSSQKQLTTCLDWDETMSSASYWCLFACFFFFISAINFFFLLQLYFPWWWISNQRSRAHSPPFWFISLHYRSRQRDLERDTEHWDATTKSIN